ncbi:hypothetical protein HNP46_004666 [Pseudomonas nitritireducens]|uniref:Uncharacterized protein n=1 Tax=Pseudomonas nitroreducens TaxID=46680 RepID=A0A7W7KMW5_PSENT|nr:hypothetical protein [Pseudomonas nitritireducens]MBB4865765.1 hypothetical protein [Pseudomonas nitritireducens]
MFLKELEPKGIYVHVDELASYIDSKITRIPAETIGWILQAVAKRVVQASS